MTTRQKFKKACALLFCISIFFCFYNERIISNAQSGLELKAGTYVGVYSAEQGETGVTLTVTKNADNTYGADYKFYPIATSSAGTPSGEFLMSVTFDSNTGNVIMKGTQWIKRPGVFSMVDLYGKLDPDDNSTGDVYTQQDGFKVGLFNIKYQSAVFKPLNVETTEGEGAIKVKDWQKNSVINVSSPVIKINYSANVPNIQKNLFQLPFVNSEGYLVFNAEPGVTGEFDFDAELRSGITGSTILYTSVFKIIIKQLPVKTNLSIEEFNREKENIFVEVDTYKKLELFSALIEKAPSNEVLRLSFKEFLENLHDSNSSYINNPDLVLQVKCLSSRVLEIISTLEGASYLISSRVYTVALPGESGEFKDKCDKIVSDTRDINSWLTLYGLNFNVESILKIDAIKTWSEYPGYVALTADLMKDAYENGIANIIMCTNIAEIAVKNGAFPNMDDDIGFSAERLVNGRFDLKVYQNDEIITRLNKYVCIRIPYEKSSEEDGNSLTVFREDTNRLLNMGAVYNEFFKRITFFTDHFSLYFINSNKKSFNDVSDDHWASEFVNAMASKGIILGKNDNNFKPNENVFRQEFATMIANTFKLLDLNATSNFSDVKPADWFYCTVSSVVKNKIMRGYNNNIFGTGDSIKREDGMVTIANIIKKFSGISSLPLNTDKPYQCEGQISSYAIDSVKILLNLGILKLESNEYFMPKDPMTRAESAAILYKSLILFSSQGLPLEALPVNFNFDWNVDVS